jgi:hypothetical protein
MTKDVNPSESWKKKTHKTTISLAFWTTGWVSTMAVAVFGPQFLWPGNTGATLAAVIINLVLGIGMIRSNVIHLNTLDELMQKIQLQSMGIALGVGVVGGLTYSTLDITNLIPMDAEIGFLVMLISVTYLVSIVINTKRFK